MSSSALVPFHASSAESLKSAGKVDLSSDTTSIGEKRNSSPLGANIVTRFSLSTVRARNVVAGV